MCRFLITPIVSMAITGADGLPVNAIAIRAIDGACGLATTAADSVQSDLLPRATQGHVEVKFLRFFFRAVCKLSDAQWCIEVCHQKSRCEVLHRSIRCFVGIKQRLSLIGEQ